MNNDDLIIQSSRSLLRPVLGTSGTSGRIASSLQYTSSSSSSLKGTVKPSISVALKKPTTATTIIPTLSSTNVNPVQSTVIPTTVSATRNLSTGTKATNNTKKIIPPLLPSSSSSSSSSFPRNKSTTIPLVSTTGASATTSNNDTNTMNPEQWKLHYLHDIQESRTLEQDILTMIKTYAASSTTVVNSNNSKSVPVVGNPSKQISTTPLINKTNLYYHSSTGKYLNLPHTYSSMTGYGSSHNNNGSENPSSISSFASSTTITEIYSELNQLYKLYHTNLQDDKEQIFKEVRMVKDQITSLKTLIRNIANTMGTKVVTAVSSETMTDPTIDPTSVRKIAALADHIQTIIKAFRETQRRAYMKYVSQEQQLLSEITNIDEGFSNDTIARNEDDNDHKSVKEEVSNDRDQHKKDKEAVKAKPNSLSQGSKVSSDLQLPVFSPVQPLSNLPISGEVETDENQSRNPPHNDSGTSFILHRGKLPDEKYENISNNVSLLFTDDQSSAVTHPQLPYPVTNKPPSSSDDKGETTVSTVPVPLSPWEQKLQDLKDEEMLLRQRVSQIDNDIQKFGGVYGTWSPEDHGTFTAALTVFLSQRGRPHTLAIRPSVNTILPSTSASSNPTLQEQQYTPLLSTYETPLFLEKLLNFFPTFSSTVLMQHYQWYNYYRQNQAEKLQLTSRWREISKQIRECTAQQDTERRYSNSSSHKSTTNHDNLSVDNGNENDLAVSGTDLNTRIAIAEWKARKEAEKMAKEIEERTRIKIEEENRTKRWEVEQEQKKLALQRWKEEKLALQNAGIRDEAGTRKEKLNTSTSSPVEPDPEFLREKVEQGLQLAKEKHKLQRSKDKAKQEIIAKRSGQYSTDNDSSDNRIPQYLLEARAAGLLPPSTISSSLPLTTKDRKEGNGDTTEAGLQHDIFDFWASLPADPARPTHSSQRHTVTTEARIARVNEVQQNAAHERPVASILPNARGKSFTFGVSTGVRTMKAIPAWRKVAGK